MTQIWSYMFTKCNSRKIFVDLVPILEICFSWRNHLPLKWLGVRGHWRNVRVQKTSAIIPKENATRPWWIIVTLGNVIFKWNESHQNAHDENNEFIWLSEKVHSPGMWPLIKAPRRKRLKMWMGISDSRINRLWSTISFHRNPFHVFL